MMTRFIVLGSDVGGRTSGQINENDIVLFGHCFMEKLSDKNSIHGTSCIKKESENTFTYSGILNICIIGQ